MLRAFGHRDDCYVCDEPLYAHYLVEHGHDHPGRDEILDVHESDAARVVAWLTGEIPEGKPVFYQKHMAHHLIDDVPREWLSFVTNAFLIRDPQEMVTSLLKILPEPTLPDTGLPQQIEIFERVKRETGQTPPVVDAKDVLEDPPRMLSKFCQALGLEFQEAMLSWPPGRRVTDGVWARHWYGAVEGSTGFQPYKPKQEPVPEPFEELHRECQPYYDELYAQRLR